MFIFLTTCFLVVVICPFLPACRSHLFGTCCADVAAFAASSAYQHAALACFSQCAACCPYFTWLGPGPKYFTARGVIPRLGRRPVCGNLAGHDGILARELFPRHGELSIDIAARFCAGKPGQHAFPTG